MSTGRSGTRIEKINNPGENGLGFTTLRKVIVTGANGFVGAAMAQRLLGEGWVVVGTFRDHNASLGGPKVLPFITGDINGKTDWAAALRGVDTVVHTAGRAHIVRDTAANNLSAFRRVNVQGTENLARQAADSGVKRFLFLSSVKVNGESRRVAYKETDKPAPKDSYGISKMEAEQELLKIAAETGMAVIILRPPLVYGPKVKANFLRLIRIVDRGIPLPFAWVKNQRSLIYVENLADAIVRCIRHADVAFKTYLIRDDTDVTTPELIRMMASALGKPSRLFGMSPKLLRDIAHLLGKENETDRLIGSLIVDDSKIRRELNWNPPVRLKEGLKNTADWFKRTLCSGN